MKAGGNFYYYDYVGRIINAKQQKAGGGLLDLVTYAYTPDGDRIMKKNPSTYPYTTYYPTRNYEQTDAGGILIRLYLGNQAVATVDERSWTNLPPDRRYIHPDNLGSARVVTDQSGAMVELMYYEPFGVMSLLQQFSGPPYYDEKRKFTGHFHDDETGLEYMEARYYTAGWGRFMAQDPLFLELGSSGSGGGASGSVLSKLLTDPQSLNSYAYARNNPLRYTDPDGRFWKEVGAFGGGLVKGAAYIGGLAVGTAETAINLAAGAANTVMNPIDTAVATYNAVTHPDQVWNGITAEASARLEAVNHMQDSVESAFNAGRAVGKTAAEICAIACTAAAKLGIGDDAASGASLSTNGLKLQKQLASEAQMAELNSSGGHVIAGHGSNRAIDDIQRLTKTYGGNASDWAKVKSSAYKASDGTSFQAGGYSNVATGKIYEIKTKIDK